MSDKINRIEQNEQKLSDKINRIEHKLSDMDDRMTETYNLTNETNFIKVSFFYILMLIINLINLR